MLTDQFGNPVSTRNRKALEAFDQAVSQFNVYRGDPIATIDTALSEDPSFVMGHCFKAGLLATTTEQAAEPAIKAAVEAATQAAKHATERERMHIGAARAWADRDFARAVMLYGEIVSEYPRDILALQIAHLGDFYLGQAPLLRDRPAQVLSVLSDDDPARGIVLGMHAFGLEECGQYAQAEVDGRRSIEINPGDAWGAHAVAHVLEMQGRVPEGIQWLNETSPGWSDQNFFAFHNWWHLALYHLDQEQYDAVLRLYDTAIRPTSSKVILEMIDASALLWRLRLRGVDVGTRWEELARSWEAQAEDGYYAFNDVHALMAFLATGREREVQRVLRSLENAAQRLDTNGMMSREVGLPFARALIAFEHGAYATTISELQLIRGIAHRFGGSHAQRDIIHLTLTEAAVRAGKTALVRALSAERLALKPRSTFNLRLMQKAA